MPTPARPNPSRQLIRSPTHPHASGESNPAQIDAHVKDREARIAPPVALRIELPHHRADVGLEQSRAENQQPQAGIESLDARTHQDRTLPPRSEFPPYNTARLCPKMRSATHPPGRLSKYTMAV